MTVIACFVLAQFGIAVERARLSDLWGEPVALVSSEGTVQVVSDEAACFGVQAGQLVSAAKSFCSQLLTLPYDRAAYETAAEGIWDLFAIESSFVEPVSPETCFVQIECIRPAEAAERARALSVALSERVHIPLLAGVGRTKLLAYRAALSSSGSGILTVSLGEEAALLSGVPIEQLPKLDFKTKQKLKKLGVTSVRDVLKLPPSELRRQFRGVGHLLQRLALGEDADPVKALWPPPSLDESVEFEDETSDRPTVEEALRLGAQRIAERLRARREFCRKLRLTVGQVGGAYLEAAEKLIPPQDDEALMSRAALRLLDRLPLDRPLLSVRLQAAGLGAGSGLQLSLLDDNRHGRGLPHERQQALDATLSFLRGRYGVGCIVTAGILSRARRIGLWTYALTHRLSEPVQVATDQDGQPLWYLRNGRGGRLPRRMDVVQIQNEWKETVWFWGSSGGSGAKSSGSKTVYRVETIPSGLYELSRLGVEWRLGGIAD